MFDPIPYAAADVREALGDYLAIRANLGPTDPHPIAETLARGRRRVPLMDVARHLAGLSPGAPDHQVRSLLAAADFGNDLGVAMARVIGVAYDRQAAEHLQICADVPVRGTLPASMPLLDLGELTKTPKAGGPLQLPLAKVTAGATVQPAIWNARFLVPRELLVNDEAGIIAAAVRQLAGHGARIEAQQLAAQVNTNGNLPDGAPLIGAGNSTTATGVTAASVAEALGKLRTNTTPAGNVANVRGAFLLVPPSLEATALIVVAAMSLGTTPRLVVVVNSWLSGSAAYMLADPQESPVFVRSFPEGSGPLRPDIGRISATVYDATGAPLAYDGQAYLFEHIFGIAAVDRQGIVKVTAAS